jgi:ribonuclease VapC
MLDEPPRYVLDSFALLSHFQDDSRRGRVVELLGQAQQGICQLLLSMINLGEICYIIERKRGLRDVHLVLAAIESLPIEVVAADRDAVFAAAHLKANFPISYADAFAAAAAQTHSAILLTGDPEFKVLDHLIQIEWIHG